MKKLLELLGTVTIASSAMLTVVTTSLVSIQEKEIKLLDSEINYSKINSLESLKRNKRQILPSLKNIITTINIGEIKKVNKNSVIKRLSEINHPILSRQDFLENIEFEEITTNSAIVHFRNWELAPLPRTLTFTINFDSDIVNFNEILGITNENAILNLNTILNNRPETIARQFIERNDLNHLLTVDDLTVTNLTNSSALIESSNINYIFSIDVIFMPRYLSLRTFITNTNLGNLRTNSKDNIVSRLEETNNLIYRNRNIRLEVRNITSNSAEVLFSQSTNSSSSLHTFHATENFDYNDIITVTFFITKIELSSVITNNNLGVIFDNTPETIIKEILRRNPNSGLTADYLLSLEPRSVIDNSLGRGAITFFTREDDNLYIGHTSIHFIFFQLLSFVITNNNLDVISDNRPETIIKEILRRNPNNSWFNCYKSCYKFSNNYN